MKNGSFDGKLSEEIVDYVKGYSFSGPDVPETKVSQPHAEQPEVMQDPFTEAKTIYSPRPQAQPQPQPLPRPAVKQSGKGRIIAIAACLAAVVVIGFIAAAAIFKDDDDDSDGKKSKSSSSSASAEKDGDSKAPDDGDSDEPDIIVESQPDEDTGSEETEDPDTPDDPGAPEDPEESIDEDESTDEDESSQGSILTLMPDLSVPDEDTESSDELERERPRISYVGENNNLPGTCAVLREVGEEDGDRLFLKVGSEEEVIYRESYTHSNTKGMDCWLLTDTDGNERYFFNTETGNYESVFGNGFTAALEFNEEAENGLVG